jgi:hypothetical protein
MFSQCQQEEETIEEFPQHDHPQEIANFKSVQDKNVPEMELPEPEDTDSPVVNENLVEKAARYYPELNTSNSNARISSLGVTDFVDFNDPSSLLLIPDYAKYTFANAPFYIQAVGDAWFHVKENNGAGYIPAFTSNYAHYHLGYQNFTPIFQNGGVWKFFMGNLQYVNPLLEPRTLSAHHGTQWIKIYAYDYDESHRPFEFWGIKVIDGPVQVWMRNPNGSWHKWSSLGEANWSFNFPRHVTEILISGVDNQSFTIDNIKVKMPYDYLD